MNYKEFLQESAERVGNIACMGIDPVAERIPIDGKPEEVILEFYANILNKMKEKNVSPAAFKPNIL